MNGEQDFSHYYGPNEPESFKDPRFGKTVFSENVWQEQRMFKSLDLKLYFFKEFFKDLNTAELCPNDELSKNADYMRYLYRLSALSYLKELFNQMEESSKKMKFGKVCEISLPKLLSQCGPNSDDMKLFIKSAKVLSKNFSPFLVPYDFKFDEYYNSWRKDLTSKKVDSAAKKRISVYCEDHNCSSLSKKKMKKAFEDSCNEDSELFVKICSEKDKLYGISSVEQLYHAISSSDVMKVLNEQGNARGCLARYTSVMKDKELEVAPIQKVFPLIYEDLKRNKGQLGGVLFDAGSLKMFVEEGLADIFVEKKVEKKKVVQAAPVEEYELGPLAPAPLKQIFKPRVKKKIVKVEEKKVEKKEVIKSHFLKSAEALVEFDLEKIELDMLKFKYDYVFNSKMHSYLEGQMPKFFAREGLEDMKKFDSLGTKKGPVPLLFLKYLIEEGKHQGLFNLVEVVGNEFYVRNNIDDESIASKADYVRLDFSENGQPQWRLSILKNN
ncbi:MAG: hypothetical protein KC478_01540 [Bacteriovoracaceae bacterium]|nr:hypothetical protein [Bacteriovoracaceae bacterium]